MYRDGLYAGIWSEILLEALNKSIQDLSRPLVPDAALPPASMQARARKLKMRTQLASKSVTCVTARLLDLGRHILVSRETLT